MKEANCEKKNCQANCSLHTNAVPFMLKAHEWRNCCFYVKHSNYKKPFVTAPLVKLNLTWRINSICSFNDGWGVKFEWPFHWGWRKSDVKRLRWNKDDIWPEIVCLCIRKKKMQQFELYKKVTRLYIHIHLFVHSLVSFSSHFKRYRNKICKNVLKVAEANYYL